MRILVASHSTGHYRQRRMWEWIAEQGHEVMDLCPRAWSDERYSPIKRKNFILQPLDIVGDNIYAFSMPMLFPYMHHHQPDVVVCMQEPASIFAYDCLRYSQLLDSRFVLFTWENIMKSWEPVMRRIEGQVITNADLCIGGNKEATRILNVKNCRESYTLPQTGLDDELFVPHTRLEIEKDRKPRILYVGRLSPEKDIEGILIAWDNIISKLIPNAELMFVGGRGGEKEKIINHKDFGKRILLQEWTPYEKLPEVYSNADVVVYPSVNTENWIEQFGAVIPESLLCETPIVSTVSGAIPEYWRTEGVFLGAPGDRMTLGYAVVSMLKHPMRAKVGRQYVKDNYSLSVVGKKYIQLLEEIL